MPDTPESSEFASQSLPSWLQDQVEHSEARFVSRYRELARDKQDDLAELKTEAGNLMAALQWYLNAQSHEAVDMILELEPFLHHYGYWHQGLEFLDQALPLAEESQTQHPEDEECAAKMVLLQISRVAYLYSQGLSEEADQVLAQVLESGVLQHRLIQTSMPFLTATLKQFRADVPVSSEKIEGILEQVESIGNQELFGSWLIIAADLYAGQGEFDRAVALYRQKLNIDRATHSATSIIETLKGLARVAELAGFSELAVSCYQHVAQIASLEAPEYETVSEQARLALEHGDYVEADQLYGQAIAIARTAGNQSDVASCLRMQAFAKEEIGQRVVEPLRESLDISRKLHDHEGAIRSMIQLASAYETEGDLVRARDYYAQAQSTAARINNQPLLALTLRSLGDLALEQDRWKEAEQYYANSLQLNDQCQDVLERAVLYKALGRVYHAQKQTEKCREALLRSADLYRNSSDSESYAEVLFGLAQLSAIEENSRSAASYAEQSLAVLETIRSPYAEEVRSFQATLNSKDLNLERHTKRESPWKPIWRRIKRLFKYS